MQQSLSQNGGDLSPISQQGFNNLSSQSNQHGQMNDYSKNQPPPRKQNTACDACRSRKVKCNRIPGQDKCQHCQSKNYPCTHYVQQATSEKKRAQSMHRRPRNLSGASKYPPTVMDASGQKAAVLGRFATPPSPSGSSPATMPLLSSVLENGTASHAASPTSHLPLAVRYGFTPNITLQTTTRDLLGYIFAPPDSAEDHRTFLGGHSPNSAYDAWGDEGHRLENDRFRAEFTLDLVEVYFQIVHTRIPLLNRDSFKARLELGASLTVPSQSTPLHPALVATVLAWGTKFSEHPVLQADRKRHNGQSILAKTLIHRAQSLAEALKVHRIPNQDHIVIALLIEPLQSQIADDPTGFRGFWLTAATRHLLDLQLNHKSTLLSIQNYELKSTMIFAWWMACICDAYASAYYRRKPVLSDGDYDIDVYTAYEVDANTVQMQGGPMFSPREHLQILGWYTAAHSLARTARRMSEFWKPDTDSGGIPYSMAVSFTRDLDQWREEFLSTVGVPSNFKGDWDFVSAVSACASDATYHVMWIILFSALDDFGIKELNSNSRPAEDPDITNLKRKVVDEAIKGATRIAGLASVLTTNGYLKLDPAVMHISCIQAGTLLARLGRPEVKNCIDGLEQYSYSYEEAGEQAREMSRTYKAALEGEPQFTHMGMSVPGSPPPQIGSDHDVEMKNDYGSSPNYQDHQYTSYG